MMDALRSCATNEGGDRKQSEKSSEKKSPSLSPTIEKNEKDVYLENIIKKASVNPQQRKSQKKYHRASSDCESSENEEEQCFHSSETTTLTRDQALKLSLRKKIYERKRQNL